MKMFYFTDPMCSWCYGFSPVLKKLKENYPEIDLQIVSGGFSPGSRQMVTDEYRNFLEYHWRNVSARSGQPFDHSMKFVSDTFHYDTEPSSRALAVVHKLLPDWDFEFLSLMQTLHAPDMVGMRMNQVLYLIAVSSMTALMLACQSAADRPAAVTPPPVLPVMQISGSSATTFVEYPASIQGAADIDVRPQVSGYLQKTLGTRSFRIFN